MSSILGWSIFAVAGKYSITIKFPNIDTPHISYPSLMAQPKPVKVLQVSPVAPTPPQTTTSTAATSLPLTFFDAIWLRFPPVERVFFYELPHQTSSFFDSILPKLKHSLSLTLQYFLPLAGNLTWPHDSPIPIISYVPGDAVSLTIAESDDVFNHITCSNLVEAVKFHHLIPSLAISDEKASVLSLQITLFPNSGFSIGITTHHAVLDGNTSTSFLKSWAYICSNLTESSPLPQPLALPVNLTPFYDRGVIKDPNGFCQIQINGWKNSDGPNNRSLMVWNWGDKIPAEAIRGTFELTPSHLQKLKESTASKLKDKSLKISSFALASAYAWALMVKAEKTEIDRAILVFPVDCRSRLEPPIPSSYFGNCIAGLVASAETKSLLGNDGLISALEAIMEALHRLEEKGELLSFAKTFAMDITDPSERRVFSIAGSPRFGVYSVDFGWGRPMKVEMTSTDKTGAFCLAESRHGNGGIEIGLVLSKPVMESFATLFAQGLESL